MAGGAAELSPTRAEVLRVESGRPRYGVDLDDTRHPPGGGPQRPRGELHEGLLRRAGDGRAAVLQGQAQPAPARPAPVGRRRRRARRCVLGEREVGTLTSSAVSPALGPIGLALVRREAEPGAELARRRRRRPRDRRRAAVHLSARSRRAIAAPTQPPRARSRAAPHAAHVDARAAQEPAQPRAADAALQLEHRGVVGGGPRGHHPRLVEVVRRRRARASAARRPCARAPPRGPPGAAPSRRPRRATIQNASNVPPSGDSSSTSRGRSASPSAAARRASAARRAARAGAAATRRARSAARPTPRAIRPSTCASSRRAAVARRR